MIIIKQTKIYLNLYFKKKYFYYIDYVFLLKIAASLFLISVLKNKYTVLYNFLFCNKKEKLNLFFFKNKKINSIFFKKINNLVLRYFLFKLFTKPITKLNSLLRFSSQILKFFFKKNIVSFSSVLGSFSSRNGNIFGFLFKFYTLFSWELMLKLFIYRRFSYRVSTRFINLKSSDSV